MERRICGWVGWALWLAWVCVGTAAEPSATLGIPYKPDPPPAIDGRLDEWEGVPNVRTAATKEHCAYGPEKWRSGADLSARVWLAWRDEYLYLAADVTDDQHRQALRDRAMFRGDHMELYLDLAPQSPPGRSFMGAGQVPLGLSPGNFQSSGDALNDIPAEAVVFRPDGAPATGVLVASQKTEKGYALEASIPWSLLGELAGKPGLRPARGLELNIEVAVSDTDSTAPAQEKMLTLRPEPWERKSERLLAAVLAGSDGLPPAVVQTRPLLSGAELAPGGKEEISFSASAAPAGKDLVLVLKARLDSPRPAGYTGGMRLVLNGQTLDGTRLVNWEGAEPRVNGELMSPAAGETFNVPYAPDFDSPNSHP
ncbi:MAG: sugar-binding protein, partial [Thermoguttaceae bacterium]